MLHAGVLSHQQHAGPPVRGAPDAGPSRPGSARLQPAPEPPAGLALSPGPRQRLSPRAQRDCRQVSDLWPAGVDLTGSFNILCPLSSCPRRSEEAI